MRNCRAAAATAVAAVLGGRSLDAVLPPLKVVLPELDRALLQQLAYGCLRDWRLLEWLMRQLTPQPPKPALLAALLGVGLYQLRSTRIPPHAAVASTVDATAGLGLDRARGLVNAVLRRYQRERAQLEAKLPATAALHYSHPDWLVQHWQSDWPDRLETLLGANQAPAPMWLRVNLARNSRTEYQQQLADAGIASDASPHAPAALRLREAVNVQSLPGFSEGQVSVQDAAAQLAAPLLEVRAGQRVLDVCAAPGGKSAHLLETCAVSLTALDSDATRLQRVHENLARLRLSAQVVTGDGGEPASWWDGQPYDRILLDAPCSGTGVIRRHPDIKWLRRATDIPALASTQLRLLGAVWPLLGPGGLLLYATCSTLKAEGDDVIAEFLREQPDAVAKPLAADWGEPTLHGRRILPGQDGMDGFYYACLVKG